MCRVTHGDEGDKEWLSVHPTRIGRYDSGSYQETARSFDVWNYRLDPDTLELAILQFMEEN